MFAPLVSRWPQLYVFKHMAFNKIFKDKHTDANPLAIRWVNPDQIVFRVESTHPFYPGRVIDGPWDRKRHEFSTIPIFNCIRDRIQNDISWESTGIYDIYINKTEDAFWGREFNSQRQVNNHLRNLDRLISVIKKDGYLTQRQLLEKYPSETHKSNNDALHPVFNEIAINISRDGELLWLRQGLHRLSIAKSLNLNEVPVLVYTRHKHWQDVRNQVRHKDKSCPSEFEQHPDLIDILY